MVAEKILIGNEKLRLEWLLHGTVGYDFLNQVNGLYVYKPTKKQCKTSTLISQGCQTLTP